MATQKPKTNGYRPKKSQAQTPVVNECSEPGYESLYLNRGAEIAKLQQDNAHLDGKCEEVIEFLVIRRQKLMSEVQDIDLFLRNHGITF